MIEQAKLDEVLKGLECHKMGFCFACPFNDGKATSDVCVSALFDATVALLKAQEPRLLNAADFENNPMLDKNGRLPCWCEDRLGDSGWTAVAVGGTEERYIKSTGCRYWTSCPTDEQMEATPWEQPEGGETA